MIDYFQKNLSLLRSHQHDLAKRMEKIPLSDDVNVIFTKSGHPVPQIKAISLHSTYNPINEGKKIFENSEAEINLPQMVYGLGFGYHILELLSQSQEEIHVIEPMINLFRIFLSHVELSPFLPRVRFSVGEPPPKIVNRCGSITWNRLIHPPSYRLSKSYFDMLDYCFEANRFISQNRLKIMVVNPIYGGSLPTAQHCARALENLGHEVCPIHCEDFADSFHAIKNITSIPENANVLSRHFLGMMNEVIVSKAAEFRPDFILAIAQSPITQECIVRLKALKVPVAFWFVEDFRTLPYWKEVAGSYDYFFTIQQEGFFEKLENLGIKNYYYLPQACLPQVHKPISLDPDEAETYGTDLSFMGAAYHNRINSFQRLLDFDFKIWGTGWDLDSPLGFLVQNDNERISIEDCVKIYNQGKINLNLHSSTFHEWINPNGDFVNPRTFEIAACGGFQLTDERSELHSLFEVGKEIITFKTLDELKTQIRYYLDHDEERKSIADRARKRVLQEHTFEHRLKEMLTFVYWNRLDELKDRLNKRPQGLQNLIEHAGSESVLGRYLAMFPDKQNISLKGITQYIDKGEGKLTQNELLLLMVDQVVKEGIQE